MNEERTAEKIIERCLGRASAEVDKREGAILYDAVASVAPELAIMKMELDYFMQRTDPSQAEGEDLDLKCAERGITRIEATKAIRLGIFADKNGAPFDVPIGSRYSGDDINFIVFEKVAAGKFYLESETPGRIGNEYVGTLFPIEYIDGLATAELRDIIIPGEDRETDEKFRERYFLSLQTDAFGGNRADYIMKTNAIQGVGGTKLYRAWQGAGTVKLVFMDSEFSVPSDELVDLVQTAVDPVVNSGEGIGFAPIGHRVTVFPVSGLVINIATNLTYTDGWSYEDVAPYIDEAITAYYREINERWADSANVIVRISYIESKLLDIDGIVDIEGTTLNGLASNLTLAPNSIAVKGAFNGAAG